LEKQSDELRVNAGGKTANAFVGRSFHRIGRSKVQRHAAEEFLVIADMGAAEIVVAFLAD